MISWPIYAPGSIEVQIAKMFSPQILNEESEEKQANW